jgi:PAS domain S-box-containing protein
MKNSNPIIQNDAMRVAASYSLCLIEVVSDPVFIINTNNIITQVNKAAINKTDVSRAHLIGADITKFFTEPQKVISVIKDIFLYGFVMDQYLVLMDGQLTDVLVNGAVYKNEQEKVIGSVIVAKDVTDKMRVEKKLNWYMDRM